ncbi:cyclic-di-AMP-binding protein CbpB [Streptococcus macacae]|uniref:CBS domain protein n=1 Tax=Streptococcus macacae NCTC 11558 TaxID=764298 RepID=G5JY75_9STRE|nr:cyclic-di-AMP-binding protein CbpB [Streptococcus macacae]EHJ52643.1 CBS domain protein [Streptococcus macacae NCTC 11558]SUN77990.1 CBS domain containing protein [Streptococcus macacae NCTC 11558]
MIAKEFEDFLNPVLSNYLIPEEELAIFIDTHNTDHVLLLLLNNGFSRVPVITKDKKYVGTISVSDIVKYQNEKGLTDEKLAQLDISCITNKSLEIMRPDTDLTAIMHKLVDANFLPVVEDDGTFLGIITRKTVLKSLNNLLHNFTNDYIITKK